MPPEQPDMLSAVDVAFALVPESLVVDTPGADLSSTPSMSQPFPFRNSLLSSRASVVLETKKEMLPLMVV